jgi:CelD/BcsL family acetyltransferase involved in cellulose biosynthesis
MLSVEEVTRAADLAGYREEWQALLARTDGALFFQTYEWLTTWLERFWKDGPLAFLFVRRDGRLVGLAPLVADEHGRLWCARSVALAANEHTLRAGFLCAENGVEILDAVVGHLRATRKGMRMVLMNLRTDSSLLVDWLPAVARRHHLATSTREASSSPVVRFPADWEAYLGSRSAHLRAEIRRKQRRIEAAGAVLACVAPPTPAECARALEDVFFIERKSWKQTAGSSVDLCPEKERFCRDLAQRCAARGWLRLHLLYLDSRPVAYVFGVVFRNDFYVIQTSFDDAYRNLSPGFILFTHVLRDACRDGLEVLLGAVPGKIRDLDSLQAHSRWKSELATELLHRVHVCVSSREQLPWRLREAYQKRLKPFLGARVPFAGDHGRLEAQPPN